MIIEQEIRFNHSIRAGNENITVSLPMPRSEKYIATSISERLCAFKRDEQSNELLFFTRNQNSTTKEMIVWFRYPADVKTTLTNDSEPSEIAKEFIRIYKNDTYGI